MKVINALVEAYFDSMHLAPVRLKVKGANKVSRRKPNSYAIIPLGNLSPCPDAVTLFLPEFVTLMSWHLHCNSSI